MKRIDLYIDNEKEVYFFPPPPTPLTKFGLPKRYLVAELVITFVEAILLIIGNWYFILSGALIFVIVLGLGHNVSEVRELTVLQMLSKRSKWARTKRGKSLFELTSRKLPIYLLKEEAKTKEEELKNGTRR